MQSLNKFICTIFLMLLTLNAAGQSTVYACSYSTDGGPVFGKPIYTFPEYFLHSAGEATSYAKETWYCPGRHYGWTHCGCSVTTTGSTTQGQDIFYGVNITRTSVGNNSNEGRGCETPGNTSSNNIGLPYGVRCGPIPAGNWRIRLFGKTDTYPSKTPQNVAAAASRVENYYVLVEKDGAPVANKFVELDTNVTQDSGGHNESAHLQPRPKGAFSRMSGYTDINGKFTFTWTVPEVSGYYQLEYSCATCNNFISTKVITVGVHGLNYFGDNEVAGPNGETIYARTIVDARHAIDLDGVPSGYWIEGLSQSNLWQIIRFMFSRGWGIVALNDISLEMGGVFDISGNWKGSHFEHREGKHVDISFNRAGNVVSQLSQRRMFGLLCDRSTNGPGVNSTVYYHDNDATPHYHIRLRAEKACSRTSDPTIGPPRPFNSLNH